jgi:hypothetical protein
VTVSDTSINVRLLEVGEERLQILAPLRGYAKKTLVSLKEAVIPLAKLLNDVDGREQTAMKRSEKPSDGLTHDESAAIVLYTIEWVPANSSLYLVVNRTLRLEDQNQLEPWLPYLKLILTALFKLPSICCTVWRGTRGDNLFKHKTGTTIT